MKAPPQKEAPFLRQVQQIARLYGWLDYHTHDSRRSNPGFLDLFLTRPPRIVISELKTDKGRLRPEQKIWLDTLGKCPGVEVYLWRPRDWDTIVEILK